MIDRYVLDRQTPLHVLIRLFLFNSAEERSVVDSAFDASEAALWLEGSSEIGTEPDVEPLIRFVFVMGYLEWAD